jgi:hypothetical protein
MTINTQKLLSLFDTAAQAHGWAADQGTRAQAQTALTNYQKARKDLEQALDAQTAEITRLKDSAHGFVDEIAAKDLEIARLRTENAGLRISLRNMIGAYVRLMENGRDRIIDLGGQCDPVDVMEAADPWLRASRAALAQEQGGSDGSAPA